MLVVLGLVTAVGMMGAGPAQADEADVFFDDSYVHDVYITFADSNWYSTLYNSHANDPDDPYFPASVECDGVTIDPVGVRFKGNSSFSIPGVKKSFKIDFNVYDDDTTFVGLKKLNLNNGFKDPTMMRAKLFLDFAGAFVPSIRAVHTRLYVNGTYWGLYTAVEQVDKTFAQSRFGDDEDGNLFKGAASDDLIGSELGLRLGPHVARRRSGGLPRLLPAEDQRDRGRLLPAHRVHRHPEQPEPGRLPDAARTGV